jgi:hypothetical protein
MNKNMKNIEYMKRTFLSICCLLTVNFAAAQFSIYSSAGISGLKYTVEGSSPRAGFGFGGGLGYSFAISPSWKAGTAIELAMYNNKVSFGTLSGGYEHGTGEDKSQFSYSLKDYEENQKITMLSVPVTLQYQTGDSIKFCLTGGLKFILPVTAQANINPGTVSASGKYEHEGQTYTDLPQHGFPEGTQLPAAKSDIDLGFSAAATLEAGVLIRIFYAGIYMDYGLNNMQKTKNKQPLEYKDSEASMLAHNSILNTGLVDKINLFSVGLKIKIQF